MCIRLFRHYSINMACSRTLFIEDAYQGPKNHLKQTSFGFLKLDLSSLVPVVLGSTFKSWLQNTLNLMLKTFVQLKLVQHYVTQFHDKSGVAILGKADLDATYSKTMNLSP